MIKSARLNLSDFEAGQVIKLPNGLAASLTHTRNIETRETVCVANSGLPLWVCQSKNPERFEALGGRTFVIRAVHPYVSAAYPDSHRVYEAAEVLKDGGIWQKPIHQRRIYVMEAFIRDAAAVGLMPQLTNPTLPDTPRPLIGIAPHP